MKNVEIEIKYRINGNLEADAIVADPSFSGPGAESPWEVMPVKAVYYDTDNQDLHQAGIMYRVRSEGAKQIATIKKGGDPKSNFQRRQEWNVRVSSLDPDVSVFKDTDIGKELEGIFGKGILHPVFSCVFERRFITLFLEQETQVELAVDKGHIFAGNLTEPICELELELKQGDPEVMLVVANRIAQKYCLSPEPRSKYNRGLEMAQSFTPQG